MATATRRRIWAPTVSLLMFLTLPAFAQTDANTDPDDSTVQPLFVNQATLAVRIEAPFTTLMRERSDTVQYDGTLSFTDSSGAERTLDVKLRTRGIYRRKADTCEFAPIRLNFKKKQVMGSEFAGQDKLKLVTHCENRSDTYEQYVLREYLAYKIFNALTEYSFGARLLHATYVDSDRDGESRTRYAFVIEDNDLLAERIGGQKVEVPTAEYSRLDRSQANLVAVFQYLIGNTDYSMIRPDKDKDCCHNTELFSIAPDQYIPVPYDFDFSGIVDARYAEPHPSLNMRSVTRRRYRGICENNDVMDATLAQFRSNEAAIKQAVSSIDGMDDRSREKALRYIDGFYGDIADAKSVERNLVKKCYSAN
ncbi:MAG: hypothetical protein ACREQ8_05750 [Woeseiaceae bacterium]